MLNVNELENRWRKYKIKFYIPHLVIATSIIVIVIVMSTITTSKVSTVSPVQEHKKIEKIEKEEIKEINVKVVKEIEVVEEALIIEEQAIVIENKQTENQKTILSPSFNFMKKMKHDRVVYYEDDIAPVSIKPVTIKEVQKIEPTQIEEVILEVDKVEKIVSENTRKKQTIKIKRETTQNDIQHVIKRFKKNNNPALSLFVAKRYYELGEYHKSYNYALITNEIDDSIDASWIVFARSLVKLNEKDEAIKTLNKYIEHSHSSQAKILLDDIRTGKFK